MKNYAIKNLLTYLVHYIRSCLWSLLNIQLFSLEQVSRSWVKHEVEADDPNDSEEKTFVANNDHIVDALPPVVVARTLGKLIKIEEKSTKYGSLSPAPCLGTITVERILSEPGECQELEALDLINKEKTDSFDKSKEEVGGTMDDNDYKTRLAEVQKSVVKTHLRIDEFSPDIITRRPLPRPSRSS